MTQKFAWLAINEAIDKDGFYLEDSPELREIEREELKKIGAPDTELIEFISILPEDRDSSLVEAEVTKNFADWAKSAEGGPLDKPVENGLSNLVYYEENGISKSVYYMENTDEQK